MKLNIIKNCLYSTYTKNTDKKLNRTLWVTGGEGIRTQVGVKGRSFIEDLVTRTEDYFRIAHDDDNGWSYRILQ